MAAAAAKVEWDGEELHGRLVFLGKTCTTSTNIDIAITKSLFFHIKLLGQLHAAIGIVCERLFGKTF